MPANSRARGQEFFGANDFGDESNVERVCRVDDSSRQISKSRALFSPIWRRRKTETIAGMKPIFTSV